METIIIGAVALLALVTYAVARKVYPATHESLPVAVAKPEREPEELARLAISSTEAELLTQEVAAKPAGPKRKRNPPPEIVVDTPLGKVTFKRPRRRVEALVVALGQAEDHIRWYYDVYQRDVLKRAESNLRGYQQGKRDKSDWTSDYFEFIQDAAMLLARLPEDREQALEENAARIKRREATLLGTYETMDQAQVSAHYLSKKREPTRNAGWLQVQVVKIPPYPETHVRRKKPSASTIEPGPPLIQ